MILCLADWLRALSDIAGATLLVAARLEYALLLAFLLLALLCLQPSTSEHPARWSWVHLFRIN